MSSPTGASEEDSESTQPQEKGRMDKCLADKPFQLCKPLVVSMSLFGLLFLNCKSGKLTVVTRVYSTVALLFCWANFVWLFFAYRDTDTFGSILFLKIVIHSWSLLCCILITVTYKACHVDTSLVEFLEQWSRLLITNRPSEPRGQRDYWKTYRKHMVRRFGFLLVVSWISFIANCIFKGYLLFQTDVIDFVFLSVNHKFAVPVKVAYFITSFYLSAAWAFTICLFFLIAGVNYREFEFFLLDFKKAICEKLEAPEMEYFRRRHQSISQMLEISDDILRVFNAAGIVLSMFTGLLTLYSLVSHDYENPVVFAAKLFWLITSLGYLGVISIGGGYLNHMAHAPLKLIHNIRIKDVSLSCSLQVNMFLAKLTGESVGLTAMDMFVIDKPTILTITGGFITYFIVLIQFKQTPSTPAQVVCNCTGI